MVLKGGGAGGRDQHTWSSREAELGGRMIDGIVRRGAPAEDHVVIPSYELSVALGSEARGLIPCHADNTSERRMRMVLVKYLSVSFNSH